MLSFRFLLLAVATVALAGQGRAATLATGHKLVSGTVTETLHWQASGLLEHGTCPKAVKISSCYTIHLNSKGELARRDEEKGVGLYKNGHSASGMARIVKRDTPRQRIEFLSWPAASSGRTWNYEWKYYLSEKTKATDHFFHIGQLISRAGKHNGPIVTLDVLAGRVAFNDPLRKCHHCHGIKLSSFVGKTTIQKVHVKYGSHGHIVWTVTDAKTKRLMMKYSAKGDMGSEGSVKYGTYRGYSDGLQPVTAYAGDYRAIQA